jgi:hypothetical protein
MTAAVLTGSLVACTTRSQAPDTSVASNSPRRRFEGRVVLITGATPGIGRAVHCNLHPKAARLVFAGAGKNLVVSNGTN